MNQQYYPKEKIIRNRIILIIIIGAVLVGGYYLFFPNEQTEENFQTATQEKVSMSDIITKELADKYQATTNWEEDLTYTLHAQERLITGKPILFKGYVDDVFKRDEKYFMRFSSSYFSPVDYVLELECSQQVIDKIFTQKPDDETTFNFFDEYVVVANIQEVTKPVFALEGSAFSEDEVEIDIESSNLFTARGSCVDIAYINDDDALF